MTEHIFVFTVDELAERWSVSRHTIFRLIQSGKLKTFKIGNSRRITLAEVNRIENCTD